MDRVKRIRIRRMTGQPIYDEYGVVMGSLTFPKGTSLGRPHRRISSTISPSALPEPQSSCGSKLRWAEKAAPSTSARAIKPSQDEESGTKDGVSQQKFTPIRVNNIDFTRMMQCRVVIPLMDRVAAAGIRASIQGISNGHDISRVSENSTGQNEGTSPEQDSIPEPRAPYTSRLRSADKATTVQPSTSAHAMKSYQEEKSGVKDGALPPKPGVIRINKISVTRTMQCRVVIPFLDEVAIAAAIQRSTPAHAINAINSSQEVESGTKDGVSPPKSAPIRARIEKIGVTRIMQCSVVMPFLDKVAIAAATSAHARYDIKPNHEEESSIKYGASTTKSTSFRLSKIHLTRMLQSKVVIPLRDIVAAASTRQHEGRPSPEPNLTQVRDTISECEDGGLSKCVEAENGESGPPKKKRSRK